MAKGFLSFYLFTLLPLIYSCDSYIDITPKGAVTVDSARQYYELGRTLGGPRDLKLESRLK